MALVAQTRLAIEAGGVALADERASLSWRALSDIIDRAANGLTSLSPAQVRRIGVFAHNSAETVLAYLAALHAGVSAIPINFHLTADEVAYMLRDGEAGLLFVGPETADVGLEAARSAGVAGVIGWRVKRPGVTPWEDWLASSSATEPPTRQPPAPFLHYTSGTTGQPKGALTPPTMFPRTATVAELFEAFRDQVALASPGPGLAVGPLYHTGPLGSTRQLAGGKPLVVMSRFDPEAVLAAIERHKVSSTLMVPTHFSRLLALPAEVRGRYDLSSLQAVFHTGAACPRDVKRAMIDWLGPILVEAYGGTESGTTNMITSPEWLAKPGSVGKTLDPFELMVIGEDGAPLGPGSVGQLYFRDTTGRGIVYHNDVEKTRAAHLSPGVFTLGEVGFFDEDGYLFITDRVSDMIVSGGVNIYPAEAEQVLLRHPEVTDAAVIAAPDAAMGEAVKALIVARDPRRPPAPEALDEFCRRHLAGYKCPRSYDVVGDLGRNAMGKINKRALKAPYWPTERTIGG